MAKKLKIRFVKFEKVLAMQILEQEGEFKDSTHVRLSYSNPWFESQYIFLIGKQADFDKHVSTMRFNNNEKRDAYLKKVVHWISEEQFTGGMRELKVDEMCEVRDDEDEDWLKRRLVRILPEEYSYRYITNSLEPQRYIGYEYARPIVKRTEPTVEKCGQLVTYTWEE